MSYILTLKNRPDGVFSVIDSAEGEHIIPIWDEIDDAERYLIHTEDGNHPPLQVVEVEKLEIVAACVKGNQKYVIISIEDFMIPPIE